MCQQFAQTQTKSAQKCQAFCFNAEIQQVAIWIHGKYHLLATLVIKSKNIFHKKKNKKKIGKKLQIMVLFFSEKGAVMVKRTACEFIVY